MFVAMTYSSRLMVNLSLPTSQRGVGWTQVVKLPRVTTYFFGLRFSMRSPQKITSGS